MKKIFLLIIMVALVQNTFAQNSLMDPKPLFKKALNSEKSFLKKSNSLSSRSFTESYFLNMALANQPTAKDKNSGPFVVTFGKLNRNWTNDDRGTMKEVLQHIGRNGDIYDVFGFNSTSGKYVYKTIDIKKTALKIDSISIPVQYTRVNNTTDSMIVKIYDLADISIPASTVFPPTPVLYNAAPLYTFAVGLTSAFAYTDTFNFSGGTTFPYTDYVIKPNLTLPAGKAFAMKLEFVGDTANYFIPIFDMYDECQNCVATDAYIPNTTGYLNYKFTNLNFSGAMNTTGMFNCTEPQDCNRYYFQSLRASYNVTSLTNFNVKIDPLQNYRGCSGATVNLESSYTGMDTLNTVTMLWKSIGGGTFANGFDTFTGSSAVYSYDTNGGFRTIILTGTGSNAEVAKDTIILENFSMKSIITPTGKISCLTTDSIKLAIANVAGVGISNTIITAYDPGTTRNLAGNLNDLNAYFGVKYSWSNGGITNRSDTTFIYTKTPGTFTLTVTNFVGCQKVVNYQVISSINLPTLDFTFNPTTVCPNKPVTMTATPAATRSTWNYTYSEAGTQLGTGSTYAHTFTSSGTKSITLSADSSGCKANDVIKSITVKAAADASCKVAIQDAFSENIKVYPNPVRNGEVFIQNDMNQTLTIKITDMLGKVIATDKVSGNKTNPIDLSSAPNGVYFVELESKGDKAVQKIIVDKQ